MQTVQNLESSKQKAQRNIDATASFTLLIHNISQNSAFNEHVSNYIKNIDIENLNLEDFQSLYFDYVICFIENNLNYLNSKDFVSYFNKLFTSQTWRKTRSKNYSSYAVNESVLSDLEKLLVKINKAIEENKNLSDEEPVEW